MQKLRIRHLLVTVGPKSFGLGPVALNLVQMQRAEGIDAQIWCLDGEKDINWALQNVDIERKGIMNFKATGPQRFGFSRQLKEALYSDMGEEIDILHQHGIWTGMSRAANIWRAKYKRSTVVAPHGSLEREALRRSVWKKRLALFGYETKNLHQARCFHATSAAEAVGFRAYGIRQAIATIPNGLSHEWLNSTGNGLRFRERNGIAKSDKVLLYVGRITPVKNLEMLIAAIAEKEEQLRGWVLVIVGADEFGYKAVLEKLVREYNLAAAVRFVGFISAGEKRDAYDAATVFTLPSLREASPIAVLEALGAGVPVLTTRGTPWEELETHRCGWWREVTVQALAEALGDIALLSPDTLRSYGVRARQLVENKYTWKQAARDCIAMYSWLLGSPQKPPFLTASI